MKLNAEFVARTESLFGVERYSRFEAALSSDPVVSVRYNRTKCSEIPEAAEPVAWASDAYYLDSRPVFTADPLFHAGCYYVQEASSMFLEQVLRQYVTEPVRALDLCAAPGGKSTHLLSLLPKGSMLVANEPMPQRAQVLAENIIKWGNPSAVVTMNEPSAFSPFKGFFDFMLVDAPCSGEGMFRKDSFAVEQWTPSNVRACAKTQREILSDIWGSLRTGGLLVYSTCTFNREEDEDCVEWIVNELGAEVLPVETDESWGITGELTGCGYPVYRFIPGYTRGEGFFLALLRKTEESAVAKMKLPRQQPLPAKVRAEVEKWLLTPDEFEYILWEDRVTALPRSHAEAMCALIAKMKVLHVAQPLATLKNNKLLPLHTLAMSTQLASGVFTTVELEREDALRYLHRETLTLSEAPLGVLLLTYKEKPLGFAKNVGNRANNLYPAEWRIRKNPLEL